MSFIIENNLSNNIIQNALGDNVGIFIRPHDIHTKHIEETDPYIIASHRVSFNILNNDYKIRLNNLPYKVKHNKNITLFGKESSNIIKINGHSVILDVYPGYSHFLIDMLGKFLYLKKFYPNIKPLFINTFKETDKKQKHLKEVFETIIEKFSLHHEILGNINIYENKDSYSFDNIITFNGRSDIGSQMLFPNNIDIYLNIRELFIPKRPSLKNKNIFISRKPGTDRYLDIVPKLENEFIKRNYEVVFFEDLSFDQQVDIMYDAKNIIGIGGSGLTNLMFANLEANVMTITFNYHYYNDEWRDISESLGINHIDFQLANEDVDIYFKLFDQIDTFFTKN
jgi:hypothetical protein